MSTILLTNDLINEIVHPDGFFGSDFAPYLQEHDVLANINKAIRHARDEKILIAHAKIGFSESYIELPTRSPILGDIPQLGILKENTWSTEFHKDLDIGIRDKQIIKRGISAFYDTDLQSVLSRNEISHIVIVGIATDLAIEALVRDAHDRNYNVTVLADATATVLQETQDTAINIINRMGNVTTVAAWIDGNQSSEIDEEQ
jgi:ureidoacrylate peracid hydrolase